MANVTLNVTDNNGKEAGTLEAPEALFASPPRKCRHTCR